jgi:succinate-semialdehyde dehydrogenase / glutarate-semialdehyde dehydrogenase
VATATAQHYATVNPYTGEVVREFESLDAAGVDRAVETAHRAFSAWRVRPIEERAAIVRRAGELLAEHSDRLAALVTLEMGKRIAEAREEARAVAPDAPVGGFAG